MKWISMDIRRPRICDTVIYSDGVNTYVGWMESGEPGEDIFFYDPISKEYNENVTHWAQLPNPPE